MVRKNKKGYIALLVTLLVTVMVLAIGYYLWYRFTAQSLQKSTQELNQMNNVVPGNNQESQSVNGQLNNLRDSLNKIQQKKDAEIQNEINK